MLVKATMQECALKVFGLASKKHLCTVLVRDSLIGFSGDFLFLAFTSLGL